MKQAVIKTGGKQYLVEKGDTLDVELLPDKKTTSFNPLLVIDGDKVKIGNPEVKDSSVKAKVIGTVKGDKVISVRFKAKKRVNKKRGHRQQYSQIQITEIK